MIDRLVVALALALMLAGSATAQSEGAEASIRVGGGAASVLAHDGLAGTIGGAVTWPVGRALRIGPSLDAVGIVDPDICPVDGAGCGDVPNEALLLGLRMQQNRAGVYLFGVPTYIGWWEDDDRHDSFGATAGVGYRQAGRAGFVAELALTGALESELTALATLTVGFAFGVRPPRFEPPDLPRPGEPRDGADGADPGR